MCVVRELRPTRAPHPGFRYILSRYDAVVHMDTAAKGAEKFYKFGKTVDDSGGPSACVTH